jgi:hypothetical protein
MDDLQELARGDDVAVAPAASVWNIAVLIVPDRARSSSID